MNETSLTQRIYEKKGRFTISAVSNDPCPENCPFLLTVRSKVTEVEPAPVQKTSLFSSLMHLAGVGTQRPSEPEAKRFTLQRCQFNDLFSIGQPIHDLAENVSGLQPGDTMPQDLDCPSDINITPDPDGYNYLSIGNKQLEPMLRS